MRHTTSSLTHSQPQSNPTVSTGFSFIRTKFIHHTSNKQCGSSIIIFFFLEFNKQTIERIPYSNSSFYYHHRYDYFHKLYIFPLNWIYYIHCQGISININTFSWKQITTVVYITSHHHTNKSNEWVNGWTNKRDHMILLLLLLLLLWLMILKLSNEWIFHLFHYRWNSNWFNWLNI